MFLRNFFHVSGRIVLEDKFLSLRLVRETLERKFKIHILEESSRGLRCKIVRFSRLYGVPVPFPNPTLEVTFKNEKQESTIHYNFTCYDYYLVAIAAPLFGILSPTISPEQAFIDAIKKGLLVFMIVLLFYGTLIFLDTKYFVSRIRKALSSF